MQVQYYAQSCFRITGDGLTVLIDPYGQSQYLRYEPRFDPADVVVVTHEHGDHNNVAAVPGNPEVVRGPGEHSAKGFSCVGIPSYHDREQGAKRGANTMVVFELEGIRVAHLGDQGCELTEEQYDQLRGVQVMIAPVGGGPTLEPEKVWEIVERVRPNVFIPAHFKTDKIDLPIIPLEQFLEGKPNVRRVGGSSVEISASDLPEPTQIVALEPSR